MKEETIDYCTMFPEGWWSNCCKAHDLAYETQVPKNEADIALFKCVYDSADGWLVVPGFLTAALMFAGISLFGMKFYKRSK